MTILDFLDEYGVERCQEGHAHYRQGWANVDCPRCSPGWKHFRLGINLAHSYANCWACGGVWLPDALSKITGLPRGEVFKALEFGQSDPTLYHKRPIGSLGTYKPPVPLDHTSLYIPQRKYLESRGFKCPQLQKLWHISGIGMQRRFPWTVFIPIFYHGRPVSWTTRKIVNVEPRYLGASADEEELPHKSLLYGEDYCRNSIVVVEGVTDVWRIGPGAVATFGVDWTPGQMLKIAYYPTRAICYDNDGPGKRQARRLAAELSVFPGTTQLIQLERAKDPGSLSKRQVKKLREVFLKEKL